MNNTNLFHPIKIGNLQLQSNVVQGPLAGYSCAPFRVLAWRYGKLGFCATEMISAKDLRYRQQKPKRYLWRDPEEGTLCYQISGNDPDDIAYASEAVTHAGADIIDLNCGCPVNKIRSKGCGTKLLTTPEKIYDLVKAMKANTNAAVSIKIRVAAPQHDHDDKAVVEAAEAAGVDLITVHGRHWTERYDVDCRIDAIANIIKYANVPIFANGDVEDIESLLRLYNETFCQGIMIARAGVGQPWLYQQLYAAVNQLEFQLPSIETILATFLEHVERLQQLEGEKLAVLQARKLAKYYSRELPNAKVFIVAAQQCNYLGELKTLINKTLNQNQL